MSFQRNKKSKLVAAMLGAALAASAMVPTVSIAAESRFPDVSPSHQYYDAITNLANAEVISGFPDGEFKMGKSLTRAEASAIFAKLLGLEDSAATTPFNDVKENQWYTGSINSLHEAGYIAGYGDNTFKPDEEMTRAEFAQLIVNAYEIPHSDADLPFTDLKDGAWYESAITTLFANGLISGQSANTFGPLDKIKRGDAAWLIINTDAKFDNKPQQDNNFELSIMHMNDTHANLDSMPKTVSAVKEVRSEKPDSLLLHAGDVFTGTMYFNEFQGKADLDLLNLMDFDAMTFGNHEFDLGLSEEGHQALVDFINGANFPFVSSNVDFSGDDKFTGLFSDLISSEPENGKIYNGIIKEIDGEKVGIFGLTTVDTVDISSPANIKFENYLEEARKAVAAFEGQGVDKIVALTHIGYDDNAAVDNDLTLAEEVEGIDIIVGGHTHTKLAEPVVVDEDYTPTLIVQTGANNSNLGVLDVTFNEAGEIVDYQGELLPIKNYAEDPEAAAVLADYQAVVDELANQPIGATAESELSYSRDDGTSVRNSETALGNLITDAMLNQAKEYDEEAVMAIVNGGGIRTSINAGPITASEVYNVLPFGNTLAIMELTKEEIYEAFEISVSQYPAESGGFLHLSGGRLVFDSSKPAGERVVSVQIENEDGSYTDIQADKTYKIVAQAYIAQGGDGYTVFKEVYNDGRVLDLGLSDRENFEQHLASLGTIVPETEGRIVNVGADSASSNK